MHVHMHVLTDTNEISDTSRNQECCHGGNKDKFYNFIGKLIRQNTDYNCFCTTGAFFGAWFWQESIVNLTWFCIICLTFKQGLAGCDTYWLPTQDTEIFSLLTEKSSPPQCGYPLLSLTMSHSAQILGRLGCTQQDLKEHNDSIQRLVKWPLPL